MEKVWLKNYQKGVPAEIDINEYRSLAQLFDEACNKHADKIAYENLGHGITYEELNRKCNEFTVYLQQLGLKKGARVAIMMPNVLQYPVALFGALRGGYMVVNTNPLYTADELIHQMNDSGAEVIVVLANFAKTVEKALPHTMLKHIVVTQIGDLLPFVKRIIVNAVVKYIKKMVPAYHLPQAISFNEALSQGSGKPVQPVDLNHDDIAFLQYTGGTTGVAKGAMLTHGNMVANVLQAYTWISPMDVGEQDIIVTALPLYHIFSLTANCLTFLKAGAKNVLITNPRDIPHFIKEIKNIQFTAITGVNTLFNAMMHNPAFHEIDFSKSKLALSGGMSLQKAVALKWVELTKSRILEAYGLTETCPAVTINPMYMEDYNGSIGLPISSTEVSIRNDDGVELGFNQTGELCVRGPQVMAGYWQRPDETALVMTEDGFLRTGDMAQIDQNGFVYLIDRKKDMIVVSGFNVYPNEVEQVIGMMPGVHEVGVIGVQHEESGERVKAIIVKRDPALTAEQVIEHCREHLTGYKIPKIVEFVDELPKTNVGKILRRALKESSR
ncbi:AMP-binding protein [Legionella genomosp. 1]|uniref:AMP-binding protein n=1 Tax=Legionella genomosp. 1 TaxID=1093625 RepID=UPI0010565659|nr:AMP-binding protein [Legionella genomosp. 1]